jgi:uncharacterized protein YgiM (DUF1202 family)
MLRYFRLNNILILILAFIFFNSCSAHINKLDSFYSIPTVTYLRECPNYDCQAVTEIFNTDQVKLLEKNDNGWWRVQSIRDRKIGWTQRDLLSEVPVSAKNYYIIVDGLPLRGSPSEDVISRNLLAYGDKVQKIAESNEWWRVLVEKDRSLGWIPSTMASEKPPEQVGIEKAKINESEKTVKVSSHTQPSSKPNYYFVAAESLNLHIIPFTSSQVVKVLRINDKVEKISQSGSDWFKVRYLDTGAEGWAPARYLKDSPVTDKTQIVTRKKKSQKKFPPQNRPIQDPFESETLEPEGM